MQIAPVGGHGILAIGSAPGRISCLNIHSSGFEYPGCTSYGIMLLQNTDGVFISGNRFEQLNVGMWKSSSCVNTFNMGNYYSGNATNTIGF